MTYSVSVFLVNMTGETITRDNSNTGVLFGKWSTFPPATVAPWSIVSFGSAGTNADSNTAGQCQYILSDNTTLRILWSDPLDSPNIYSVTTTSSTYEAHYFGGGGDEAQVTIALFPVTMAITMHDWMAANMDILGPRTLQQICLFGSHDSGMCYNSSTYGLASVCNTQTQTACIGGQLNLGVRSFDLRPVLIGGTLYAGHYGNPSTGWVGAAGEALSDIVAAINNFTANHQEVIIIYLSHDYNADNDFAYFTQAEYTSLLAELANLNNLYIADSSTNLTNISINTLTNTGKSSCVIVVADPEDTSVDLGTYAGQGFFPIASFPTEGGYTNTDDLNDMIYQQPGDDQLPGQLYQLQNNATGSYLQLSWTLTQQPLDVATCYTNSPNSILGLSVKTPPALFWALVPALTSSPPAGFSPYPNQILFDNISAGIPAGLCLAITNTFLPT